VTQAVVVGSGPNGLAAAITLAAAGVEVQVLEAADRPGGGTRTSELTLPGLLHDECSGFHPLSDETGFGRQFDLGAHGLRWQWPEVQYAHVLDGGRGAAAWRSLSQTAEALGPDQRPWQRTFGRLSDGFDAVAREFLRPMLHVPRPSPAFVSFGLRALVPSSALARRFSTPEAQGLWAGVAAHAFRPFGSPLSSAIGLSLVGAGHRNGWPVAEGGSAAISRAMVSLLESLGGTVETGVTVTSLESLGSPDVVMLDLAPADVVRIAGDRLPRRVARAYGRYRHGPGAYKVEFAVAEGVPWTYEEARSAGVVHVSGDLAEVTRAEDLVHRGRMPERPFVLVGQQYVADPSRSAGDVHPLYAYAHVPHGYSGDATAAIEAQIERFAPGFRDRVLARHVRTTTQMAAYNANYHGGDIVAGANDARQLLFRPRLALDPYATGIDGVYLCSAATPPGAGAHGMCGWNAARSALKRL